MAIEIVDFPIKNGGIFHSYVNVYQRVNICQHNLEILIDSASMICVYNMAGGFS